MQLRSALFASLRKLQISELGASLWQACSKLVASFPITSLRKLAGVSNLSLPQAYKTCLQQACHNLKNKLVILVWSCARMLYRTKTYTHAYPVQKFLMDSVWNTSGIRMEEIWNEKLMESDNLFHMECRFIIVSWKIFSE